MPAFLISVVLFLGLLLPSCFAQGAPASGAPVPVSELLDLKELPPAPAAGARAKTAPRPVRKTARSSWRARQNSAPLIEVAEEPEAQPIRPQAEEPLPARSRDPMSYLVYGTIPERNMEYYAKFTGTSTYEGVQDIKAPRDGQFVLTVSSGEWVVKDDMLGFITSPEMSAIMAATPVGERMTAAQRWKQLYGAEVMKAGKNCLVAVIYRPDRSFVKKGDLLFSLAEDIYVIGESEGAPSEGFSPGMRVVLRQRRDAGAAVLPGILQEFFVAQSASEPDPLAEELAETEHKKYFVRVQVPPRAAPQMRMNQLYDGYVVMQNALTGPVVPKRALLERDGKRYLMTLSEVSIEAESDKGVQLQEAPWPGTVYVYPETLGAAAKIAAAKPHASARAAAGEKPVAKPEAVKKSEAAPSAKVPAAEVEEAPPAAIAVAKSKRPPKQTSSGLKKTGKAGKLSEVAVEMEASAAPVAAKPAKSAPKRAAKSAAKKKPAHSKPLSAKSGALPKTVKDQPSLPPGELVEMPPAPSTAVTAKSTAAAGGAVR